jgi:hypothetical protein
MLLTMKWLYPKQAHGEDTKKQLSDHRNIDTILKEVGFMRYLY